MATCRLKPQCQLLRSWEQREWYGLLWLPPESQASSCLGTNTSSWEQERGQLECLVSQPGKETQVQGGHLFIGETQAKQGQGQRNLCHPVEPPAPRGQSCSLPGSFHCVGNHSAGTAPGAREQSESGWSSNQVRESPATEEGIIFTCYQEK